MNDFRKPITVCAVIDMYKQDEDLDEYFCVYGHGMPAIIKLDSECYLDDYPEVSDDDEEVFSDFVEGNKLLLWFSGEVVQQVVINSLYQNPKVDNDTILKGISYYNEHDTFMDIV